MAPDFLHRRQTERDDTAKPVLITAARESYQDELAARKKRYYILMSIRIPALLLAAGSLALWNNPWIAVAIVAGSIPIPWIAVISANDRPPLSKEQARMYTARALATPTDTALPSGITGHSPTPGRDAGTRATPTRAADTGASAPRAADPDPDPDESDPAP